MTKTVSGFIQNPAGKCVILRHDVDDRPMNALKCARLENKLGLSGTYYFRINSKSYDESVIREIHRLGHEIGYHYEELSSARGDYEKAISLFEQNLAKLRRLAPIETICMHGSPLSKYDNRKLWEKYDYRNFGIMGEPYLDINFAEVLYLTDTGRRWDGEGYSIRDRVDVTGFTEDRLSMDSGKTIPLIHSSFDIMRAVGEDSLPPVIMLTLHPQRWDNRPLPWMKELVSQNVKNIFKSLFMRLKYGQG
ncbi:MAG: hypothetical protein IH592_09725 [Bacteroidales bacterium]|nr:hypothetical protein [Bacteroidales bacterium]